jgi:hypothetical protein
MVSVHAGVSGIGTPEGAPYVTRRFVAQTIS